MSILKIIRYLAKTLFTSTLTSTLLSSWYSFIQPLRVSTRSFLWSSFDVNVYTKLIFLRHGPLCLFLSYLSGPRSRWEAQRSFSFYGFVAAWRAKTLPFHANARKYNSRNASELPRARNDCSKHASRQLCIRKGCSSSTSELSRARKCSSSIASKLPGARNNCAPRRFEATERSKWC